MGKAEGQLITEITIVAKERYGMRLYRNTVGRAKLAGGWVTLGLSPGSPDLVGFLPLKHAVSGRFALFCGIETKIGEDMLRPGQIAFQHDLIQCGALTCTVYSIQEFILLIDQAVKQLEKDGFKTVDPRQQRV